MLITLVRSAAFRRQNFVASGDGYFPQNMVICVSKGAMPMIEEFYHGSIVRADHTPTNPEYHALMQKWLPMCDAFEKMLTPEQLNVFKEMTDLQMKSSEIADAELYAAGFRDGAQLMLEIME